MNRYKGKYDTLLENTLQRYQSGGILQGDYVKFKKNALQNEHVKAGSENYVQMIDNAIKSGLNLKVSVIKPIRSRSGGDLPSEFVVDVMTEYAPGLWKDPMTVPLEVLEKVDLNGNLPPVPDSMKRGSKVGKPEEAPKYKNRIGD